MKNNIRQFILAASLLLFCNATQAETIKLTRSQASELYAALGTAEAGFSPANTVAAADNLIALRPTVEGLDKGRQALQRDIRKLSKLPNAEEKAQELVDKFEKLADDEVTVNLTFLNLTDEELTAAKVKPGTLSVIRRWLVPPKK